VAGEREDFRLVSGPCEIPCPDAGAVAAIRYLDERQPEFVAVAVLREVAAQRVGPDDSGDQAGDRLTRFFLDALTAGALDAALSAPRVSSRASQRPVTSPLARIQAVQGSSLTNQMHESVQVTDLGRFVVRLLDGTCDRTALAARVQQEIACGRVSLSPFDEAEDPRDASNLVERELAVLAQSALLVA
jgi:hypothetical protein